MPLSNGYCFSPPPFYVTRAGALRLENLVRREGTPRPNAVVARRRARMSAESRTRSRQDIADSLEGFVTGAVP
jgi:hypothetical protein